MDLRQLAQQILMAPAKVGEIVSNAILYNQEQNKIAPMSPLHDIYGISQQLQSDIEHNLQQKAINNMQANASVNPNILKIALMANPTTPGVKSADILAAQAQRKGAGLVDDLAKEARKYKSAEEFVKAENKLKYHTIEQVNNFRENLLNKDNFQRTIKDLQSEGIKLNQDGSVTLYRGAKNILGDNIRPQSYFTTDLNTAKLFGKVSKVKINPEALMSQGKSMASGGITFQNMTELIKGKNNIYDFPVTPSQLTDIYNQATNLVKNDNLIQEARKYKSAEEFVKAQTFYRGQDYDGELGAFFTSDKKFASKYAKKIHEIQVAPEDVYKPSVLPKATDSQINNAISEAKRKGYKAFLVDENKVTGSPQGKVSLYVFDKSAIKTKSQLTDIWEKARQIVSKK